LPWLFILLMIGSLFWLLNRVNLGVQHSEGCKENLLQIYESLKLYEQEHGRLPALELFPEDLHGNPDSILNKLKDREGFDPAWLICPSAPQVLRDQGITYLWNTALNQASLLNRTEITWVLVDLQALDDNLPGPHFNAYQVLYTDGRVERSYSPPPSLPVQF